MIGKILLSGVLISFLSLFVRKKFNYFRWILFSVYLLIALYFIFLWQNSFYYKEVYTFFSIYGLDFSLNFSITPLGWLFSFFTIFLTFLISIFSIQKNIGEDSEKLISFFWFYLVISNIGIFFADDFLTLFIFWELMTFSSFFVISPGWTKSFRAVNYYFVLSTLGAFFMLLGIGFLYGGTKSFSIESGYTYLFTLFSINPLLSIFITLTFILGFFTKSALIPFHIWPAQAHAEAPDDFSAFLSGIMIKYGLFGNLLFLVPLFLLIKNYPSTQVITNGIPLFSHILSWVGAITSIVATFLAIESNDMKKLAAWSTVANIGYATTSIFILSSYGIAGGIFQIITHAIFKTAIFLALAAVKYRTHEREMHKLGGLAYRMPVTFLTFLLGIIAAAGIPPMNGYASKWFIYQSLLSGKFPFLTVAIFLSSTGAFMYLFRALHSIFLGQLPEKFDDVREVPFLMQVPMYILMALMLLTGVFPGIILKPINWVLISFNLQPVKVTYTTMFSTLSSVNSLKVFLTFFGSFAFAFILYLIGKPRKHVEPLDNYTAGQDPKEFGLTRELYHFALKFYEPFEHMFDSYRTNTQEFYDSFERKVNELGSFIKESYSKNIRHSSYIFIFALVLVILYGWLVW
ncbi:MAG: proton-conducting transporter membrane subunit [bacterium]|uniref:NADH/Ubiquinone/plastoquinone (Complex I) n=2 Tax=Bacteria candidate phyla TaxID=1783234 RepID=A0A101I055_UNCT6|nr:MAG: NADH/Ubiquinone/plastoquinone (Complex I) [candidate division TA06 bacterium 32_111]KUK86597.1 MAG: NADH/Ubiquinone/plastoquinone (Complex I) [candidate division TA06 bacterium 34_109]MDI6701240.1 proton-conducting transporter membrane subunit [bacterium]HAF07863.1 NADH-quinone oxidoreductase subunit M [candidate division WOR-3 bacterium]HCP17381.1 NADH-quinone oxidoreductase subunit M [candidate division WOR-3 bacterium]